MYRCFCRNWWKRDANGKLVPNVPLPRGNTIARFQTMAEARDFCTRYNATHHAGPLSHKCEFAEVTR